MNSKRNIFWTERKVHWCIWLIRMQKGKRFTRGMDYCNNIFHSQMAQEIITILFHLCHSQLIIQWISIIPPHWINKLQSNKNKKEWKVMLLSKPYIKLISMNRMQTNKRKSEKKEIRLARMSFISRWIINMNKKTA